MCEVLLNKAIKTLCEGGYFCKYLSYDVIKSAVKSNYHSFFSVKPFSQSPFSLTAAAADKPIVSTAAAAGPTTNTMATVAAAQAANAAAAAQASAASAALAPSWQGRAIATHKLRMLEFSAFVEQKRGEVNESFKHHFVHIGGPVSYADPVLEVSLYWGVTHIMI